MLALPLAAHVAQAVEFKTKPEGRLIRLVRPKSLRKLRESIKPKTRRNNGKGMDVIVAEINRTLKGWIGYFKHVHPSELGEIDQWFRIPPGTARPGTSLWAIPMSGGSVIGIYQPDGRITDPLLVLLKGSLLLTRRRRKPGEHA